MTTLNVDGAELYYELHGEGPPLVLIHGASGTHLSWWQQVAHFSTRYTCVVFSHRGFPPSSAAPGETRAFVMHCCEQPGSGPGFTIWSSTCGGAIW